MVDYSQRPKAQRITRHAQRILHLIRATEGWITRRELADHLGKNRLNPWEQALLQKLCDEGLIEIERRLREDEITLEYIYRAVPNLEQVSVSASQQVS